MKAIICSLNDQIIKVCRSQELISSFLMTKAFNHNIYKQNLSNRETMRLQIIHSLDQSNLNPSVDDNTKFCYEDAEISCDYTFKLSNSDQKAQSQHLKQTQIFDWFKTKRIIQGFPQVFYQKFEKNQKENISHTRKPSQSQQSNKKLDFDLFSCQLMIRRGKRKQLRFGSD